MHEPAEGAVYEVPPLSGSLTMEGTGEVVKEGGEVERDGNDDGELDLKDGVTSEAGEIGVPDWKIGDGKTAMQPQEGSEKGADEGELEIEGRSGGIQGVPSSSGDPGRWEGEKNGERFKDLNGMELHRRENEPRSQVTDRVEIGLSHGEPETNLENSTGKALLSDEDNANILARDDNQDNVDAESFRALESVPHKELTISQSDPGRRELLSSNPRGESAFSEGRKEALDLKENFDAQKSEEVISTGKVPKDIDSASLGSTEVLFSHDVTTEEGAQAGMDSSALVGESSASALRNASRVSELSRSVDEEPDSAATSRARRDSWEPSPSTGIDLHEAEDHFDEVELVEPGDFDLGRRNLKAYSSAGAIAERDLNSTKENSDTVQDDLSGTHNGIELIKRIPPSSDVVSRGGANVVNEGLVSFRSLNFSPIKEALPTTLHRAAHSIDGSGMFPSPRGSPLLQKGIARAVLPNVSPELMNLIDSVIQGSDRASLHKLRGIVGGTEACTSQDGDDYDRETVSKYVVDTLIAKMGGVDGLDELEEDCAPRMMLGAGAALVAGEILPWLPYEGDDGISMSPRTRMAKALALILQACTRNRAMCSAAGLLRVLLGAARSILLGKVGHGNVEESWDIGPLLDAIEALGSHCLTVKDLREWLSTAAKTSATGKSLDLLLTLERTMSGEETRGPSYSFEFDGESSGLLGPGESKWPFWNGYAFATWLYIESFADTVNTAAAAAAIAAAAAAKTGKSSAMSAAAAASALAGEGTAHMPRLFSFLSVDNLGVEAYFHGQFLVVESVNGKGRKASLHFTHAFKPRRWYFVGLEHTHKQSLLGKVEGEMKLYIDGRLYESRPLVFPRLSRPLGFCCIGTNPPAAIAGLQRRRRQCPLFAEMGPIYIFKEPLGQERMAHLAFRGGDALPSFGAGAGAPWFANNEQAMTAAEESAALDLELGPRLHLLYHPKLLSGRSCPDASPAGASGVRLVLNLIIRPDYVDLKVAAIC